MHKRKTKMILGCTLIVAIFLIIACTDKSIKETDYTAEAQAQRVINIQSKR